MSDDVEITWDASRAANLLNWDDRVTVHEQAYGLEAFDDPGFRSDVVRDDLAALAPFLPDAGVAGLDVCHLQCHIGTDTVSLARAGARVTAVDFSAAALESGRRLAARAGSAPEITWVESDVLDARAAVSGSFDLVYTSIGTIVWLPDLDRWAAQIVALLRPGGLFFIRDGHPTLGTIDFDGPEPRFRWRYFATGRAEFADEETSYVGDGRLEHTRSYQWAHPICEILNALLGAGLRLLRFDEGRLLPWRINERMVQVPGGFEWPGRLRDVVPNTFTVIARFD